VIEQGNIETLIAQVTWNSGENIEEQVNSKRLFHGRGQCYPGLEHIAIDWFAPALVVTLFDNKGEEWEQALITALQTVFPSVSAIYVQRRYQPRPSFELVSGTAPDEWFANRNGLRFALSTTQQNIGYFLDIEQGRCWLEARAQGARVLNLFSYTCTFSVVAAAAGAESVVNMDLSSKSLTRGRDNHRTNNLNSNELHFYAYDILKSWSKVRRHAPYDLVICDPPSFQKGSFIASRDYPKVLRRLSEFIALGGQALLCLNSPEVSCADFKAMIDAFLSGFTFIERLDSHPDFPERDPDCALKLLVYQKVA
jgi:23S rRNA (cytosine1962-C5)-methyltransferase